MSDYLSGKPGMGNEDIFVGNMSKPMFVVSDEQQERLDDNQDKALLATAHYALERNLSGEDFVDMTQYLGLDERLDLFAEQEGCTDIVQKHRAALEVQWAANNNTNKE